MLAIGTVSLFLDHAGSGYTQIRLCLTDGGTTFLPEQTVKVAVAENAGSGRYQQVATTHALFPVSGGLTFTCRFIAQRTFGTNCVWDNVHLTLVYIPTARGTVETAGSKAEREELLSRIERLEAMVGPEKE